MIRLTLPVPPSANRLWRYARGRRYQASATMPRGGCRLADRLVDRLRAAGYERVSVEVEET